MDSALVSEAGSRNYFVTETAVAGSLQTVSGPNALHASLQTASDSQAVNASNESESNSGHTDASSARPKASSLPPTLYREHIENCELAANAFTFDFMSDYLTMMDVLAKAITHTLSSACGLTPLQYRILLRLLEGESLLTKELATDLEVGMSTISTAVSKLVCKGLVSRADSINDMRVVELSLTDKGCKAVKVADEAIYYLMTEYWSFLTPEQFEAAMVSANSAVMMHSHPRLENGKQRMDTALVDTVMISRSLTSHALERHGLTTGDYRIMLALKILGFKCHGADIAKFLFLNSSDITTSLKNLEANGYITRYRCAENRRARILELTPAGDEKVISLLPVVFDSLHETCHSDDELIRIHISAARDLVIRKRHTSNF